MPWKTPSRSSCLDLTFTNLDFPIFCEVIGTHIRDHLIIVGSFDIEVSGSQHSVLSISRYFRDFDVAKFVLLQQARLELVSGNDLETMWVERHSQSLSALNNCAPFHTKRKTLDDTISSSIQPHKEMAVPSPQKL